MKKIILGIILGIVILLVGIFGWRVYHYYQLIKKGGPAVGLEGAMHFSQGQNLPTGKAGLPKTPVGSSGALLRTGAPELGNPLASLTIVEFADFTCSYSREAFPVMRELLAKYPDKIRFVFRFFPLEGTEHQGGQEAAWAALCAQEQGKFWAYHDKLFQNQKNFTAEDLKNYARQVGLDESRFDDCLASQKYQEAVSLDYRDGLSLGVAGTPTFFVNGQKVEGAVPLEEWERVLKMTNF